jgi:Kef-type K+ transport system membrane component KefB
MTAGIVTAAAVHPGSFLIIVVMAATAATIATLAGGRGIMAPVVVLELLAGVLIGPQVLGVQVHEFTTFFSDLGLAMLFFFVGYEIEYDRIKGPPLRLAAIGWVLSLALAYGLALVLVVTGVVISALYTGSAFTTTSLGTLLPILSDSGELRSRFGTLMLAAGAVGEFGPILLITLVLSTQRPLHNALILVAFIAAVLLVGLFAVRSTKRTMPLFERTLETSPQLAVCGVSEFVIERPTFSTTR